MKMRRSECAVGVAGAIAGVAALIAIWGSTRWAAALAMLGLGLGLVGLARIGQLVLGQLAAVTATSQGTRRVVDRIERKSGRAARASGVSKRKLEYLQKVLLKRHTTSSAVALRTLARIDESIREARLDSHRFRTSLDMTPSDTVRLMRASDRLMPGTADFPGLGDWAITTSTLLAMVDDVASRRGHVTIVECGSGTSTLFLALALSQRHGGGRIVALESDAAFAEETRAHLVRAGVDHLAQVVDAPLTAQQTSPGDTRLWFDTTGLPEVGDIDLLFVDGPVGGTFPEARFPALPFFAERLRVGATVVLDDTDRPDERSILEKWTSQSFSGRRLEITRRNVRSTLLRVVEADNGGTRAD